MDQNHANILGNLSACPRIISREEWGGRPPVEEFTQEVPVPYVVIHHGVSKGCLDQASCSAIVRSYQNHHMDTNGWPDIGYNFLVGEDGNVYKGRGWTRAGAHAPGYNYNSVGVCFIGTFTGAQLKYSPIQNKFHTSFLQTMTSVQNISFINKLKLFLFSKLLYNFRGLSLLKRISI